MRVQDKRSCDAFIEIAVSRGGMVERNNLCSHSFSDLDFFVKNGGHQL